MADQHRGGDKQELAHNDHPLRHFDRTCSACIVKDFRAQAFEIRSDRSAHSNYGDLLDLAAEQIERIEAENEVLREQNYAMNARIVSATLPTRIAELERELAEAKRAVNVAMQNHAEAESRAVSSTPHIDLLRRIRKANIIFPSLCANNMDAVNLLAEIDAVIGDGDVDA